MKGSYAKVILCAVLAAWAAYATAGPGKKQYDEFAKQGDIYDDPAWQAYVQQIGDRLVSYSSEPNREFHFIVLDSADVNAFAMPDGYIFVYRGLIAYLESEDQLAGVIGHEIGHVVLHHQSRRSGTQAIGKVVGFVGAVATGQSQLMDVANQYTAEKVSGYGREMELEADKEGGELLAKAGYNPFAMIEVIQILKDQEQFATAVAGGQKTYHGVFASHPQNDKRLHDAVAEGQNFLPDELVEPVADFWQNINGLVYGNQAGSGIVKDESYYHEGLRIVVTFPQGWDVASSATKVTGSSPAGATVGVITFQKQASPTKKQTPKEYVTDTLQRDVVSGEDLKVGDYEAFIGNLDLADSNLKASMVAVIYKDGAVYLFKGEAGETADPTKLEADFRATVQSFRPMVPADLKIANNQRIKVIEAKPGDTFKRLAQKSSLKSHPEETLRLLNGDHPLGEPRPGDFVK
ncbi:MAG: M48 family metalloprotease, partial [Candidatus Binatia bacterium]